MALVIEKRIIFAAILTLTLVIGGFWFFNKSGGGKTAINTESPLAATAKTIVESPDSDSDGLKDWEEKLWGTNSDNPDTDGDKTPDGEEIKLGRNPLVAGPNDLLTDTLPKSGSGSEKFFVGSESLTNVIAKEAFQSFIEQVNLGADEEEAQRQIAAYLAINLQNQTDASGRIIDEFTIDDIKTGADNSKEAIKNYINMVGKITSEEAGKTQGNELILLTKLIEEANSKESRKKFEEFENYVMAYNSSRIKMASLAIPKNYAKYHLSLVNILNNMSKINKTFVNFMLDPVKGILAIKSYSNEAVKLVAALNDLERRLSTDGINIGPEDGGYVLFQ